jgi:Carbonic anhydrase
VRNLVDGIHRFQSGVFGAQRELFRRLADRQEPDALLITCSDSRIVPNLITQTRPGEIFILRNAGMAALARGRLTLHAWIYDIAEGSVHAFDPDRGQYVPIAEAGQGARHEPGRTGRRREI